MRLFLAFHEPQGRAATHAASSSTWAMGGSSFQMLTVMEAPMLTATPTQSAAPFSVDSFCVGRSWWKRADLSCSVRMYVYVCARLYGRNGMKGMQLFALTGVCSMIEWLYVRQGEGTCERVKSSEAKSVLLLLMVMSLLLLWWVVL